MFRKTTSGVAAVGLALAVLASEAQAEGVELTDGQMDQITAGAFAAIGNTYDMVDVNNIIYKSAAPGSTIYIDSGNVSWQATVLYYFPNNVVFGVLINPLTGQIWDGGFSFSPQVGFDTHIGA
jgi:hypothetical protein